MKFIHFLFIIQLFSKNTIYGNSLKECVILDKFRTELQAEYVVFESFFNRNVHTSFRLSHITDHFNGKHNSYIWLFKPVEHKPNTYYLINKRYNEYLYPIDYFSNSRRKVITKKVNSDITDESFMWTFKPDKPYFEIYNLKYQEALRVSGPTYTKSYNRYVYTSSLNSKESDNFKWKLKCLNNDNPLFI